MRVLGLDLSSRAVGWALLEDEDKLVDWGVLSPSGKEFSERLTSVVDGVCNLVRKLRPDAVALERPIYARNAMVAIKLGGIFWTVFYTLRKSKVAVFSYEPAQAKTAATGSGYASKEQVRRLLQHIFGKTLEEDAADAAAVALAHLHRRKIYNE